MVYLFYYVVYSFYCIKQNVFGGINLKKIGKSIVVCLMLSSSLSVVASAEDFTGPIGDNTYLKSFDSVPAVRSLSDRSVTPFDSIPNGKSLNYSYFGDLRQEYTSDGRKYQYVAKSLAYLDNYSQHQSIDYISAKARIYTDGILGNSKEDATAHTSYAAAGTDLVAGPDPSGYGNHTFKNAGYTDYTPESHDTSTHLVDDPY